MRIFEVFKTYKFSIIFSIEIIFFIALGLIFSGLVSNLEYKLDTYGNCESTYIAYDSREFENNCYVYYEKQLNFNLSKGDSVRINCESYQFIDNVKYDTKSLINEKNVIYGEYKILDANEIAIPEYVHKHYKLNVNDFLYLSGSEEYRIKFVFRDIGDVKNIKSNSTEFSIFFGKTKQPIISQFKYAVFDNNSNSYNKIYLFSNHILNLKQEIFTYMVIFVVFMTLIILTDNLLFIKDEKKQLYKVRMSGSQTDYYRMLIVFNFLLIMLPTLIGGAVICAFGNLHIFVSLLIVSIIVFLVKIITLRIKIR